MMFAIRPILPQDNAALAAIIRQVSVEYGLAAESGYAVADPILDQLSDVYSQDNSQYWVVTDAQDRILGGGGIAPLKGLPEVLEIQKMYFLPELRGHGMAKKILQFCFEYGQQQGFKQIYLETTASLHEAIKLYEKLGFVHLSEPMGNTGHSAACEIRMLKQL